MGIHATVVYDGLRHRPLALRTLTVSPTERNGLVDTVASFGQHCASLKGIVHSPVEVSARWGGPPYITYVVVRNRFRVIAIWGEDAGEIDVAQDVHDCVQRLSDVVTEHAASLAEPDPDALAAVYEEAGLALRGEDPLNLGALARTDTARGAPRIPGEKPRTSEPTTASAVPKKRSSILSKLGKSLRGSVSSDPSSRKTAAPARRKQADVPSPLPSRELATNEKSGKGSIPFDDAPSALQLPDEAFAWADFGEPIPNSGGDIAWLAALIRGEEKLTAVPKPRLLDKPPTPKKPPTEVAGSGDQNNFATSGDTLEIPNEASSQGPNLAASQSQISVSSQLPGPSSPSYNVGTPSESSAIPEHQTPSAQYSLQEQQQTFVQQRGAARQPAMVNQALTYGQALSQQQTVAQQQALAQRQALAQQQAISPHGQQHSLAMQQSTAQRGAAVQEAVPQSPASQITTSAASMDVSKRPPELLSPPIGLATPPVAVPPMPPPDASFEELPEPVAEEKPKVYVPPPSDDFDVSALGGYKDDASSVGVASQGGPGSNASLGNGSTQGSAQDPIRTMMNEFANAMQGGNYLLASQKVSMALRALSSTKPLRTREIITCANYTLGLKILIRLQVLDREIAHLGAGTPQFIQKSVQAALLSMFLAELKHLLPRHRIVAMSIGIEKNIVVGNFGMTARWIRQIADKSPLAQQQVLARKLQLCVKNGELNAHMPPTNRLCYNTLNVLTGACGKCTVCTAVYYPGQSGVNIGQNCPTCFVGSIIVAQ